jgi:diguanylate cyclase
MAHMLLPVVFLLVVAGGMGVTVFQYSVYSLNMFIAKNQSKQIEADFEHEYNVTLETLQLAQKIFTFSNNSSEDLLGTLRHFFRNQGSISFDSITLYTAEILQSDNSDSKTLNGISSSLRRLIKHTQQIGEPQGGYYRLEYPQNEHVESRLVLVGAIKLYDGSVLVAQRFLNAESLNQLADHYNMPALSLQNTDEKVSYVNLPHTLDERPLSVFWNPQAPKYEALKALKYPLFLGASVVLFLSILVLYRIRNVAHEVASHQHKTEETLGRDAVSKLRTRAYFEQKLDETLQEIQDRQSRHLDVAVHVLDLDKFKSINVGYGVRVGDALIQAIGQRLLDLHRGADTVARLGGDRMAILQTDVRNPRDAELLACRIVEAFREPFLVEGASLLVTTSLGVTLVNRTKDTCAEVLRRASTALNHSKNHGRNRWCLFDVDMQNTLRLQQIVEDDLRKSIENDELEVYYQPLIGMDSQTVVCAEALVRWNHPRHGFIPPSDFIPIAEEQGLIVALGHWVMRRACVEAVSWGTIRVAVNVSAIQFRQKNFVASVAEILKETGLPADRLEIELTEGVLVNNEQEAIAVLDALHTLGVHLALDDFGTGYSSLFYLRRFSFDKIKIDKSFLVDLNDSESTILVHSMVHLGRSLGLTVTVEGVETSEQHRFLQALGCHEFQGYLFAKPMPYKSFQEFLKKPKKAVA